jgi:hypothetical protein
MRNGSNGSGPSAISPLGHRLTPPNVPNVRYQPTNIMVEYSPPPSASSSYDSYLYPPMPPDVTQISLDVLDPA